MEKSEYTRTDPADRLMRREILIAAIAVAVLILGGAVWTAINGGSGTNEEGAARPAPAAVPAAT